MSILTPNDFIFYKEGDNIMSGGYKVKSILLKKGISPINPFNNSSDSLNYHEEQNMDNDLNKNDEDLFQGGKSVSKDLFENLAVPFGLCYFQNNTILPLQNIFKEEDDNKNKYNDELLPDNLYEELINMVKVNNPDTQKKLRKTKKIKQYKNKTKKK
jgi:hypothetical protein